MPSIPLLLRKAKSLSSAASEARMASKYETSTRKDGWPSLNRVNPLVLRTGAD